VSKLVRIAVAVVIGLVVWTVVATLGNFVLRVAIPGYRAEEIVVAYSLVAQVGRLALGVLSTAAAAAITVIVSRGSSSAALALGCVLLVMFVPVHVSLWHKFPVWYHLFFLGSLPLVPYVVGKAMASRRSAEP